MPHRARLREIPELPAIPLLHHDVKVVVPGQEAAVVVEAHQAPLEDRVPGLGCWSCFELPLSCAKNLSTGWSSTLVGYIHLGHSPCWWAAFVVTYCLSRVVEHAKSKSCNQDTRPPCR